ncbi:MAG: hypothetical protein HC941_26145 [Microcoleus sp. SU_5_3]|nr:hypothetical protein [Microcoleus sp. SU_5_3]
MTGEELEQSTKIAFLPNQLQSGEIVKQESQSDIEVYKEILSERFALAKTAKELDNLIELRQKVQELDKKARQLEYAQESAELQLKEAKQKAVFQRSQQVVSSIVAVGIGLYLIQFYPLASLLFLVLGLARPLGYSLGEIGELLGGMTGFFNGSDKLLYNDPEEDIQSEDSTNARY